MTVEIYIKPATHVGDITVTAKGTVEEAITVKQRGIFKLNNERLKKTVQKLRMKEDKLSRRFPVTAYVLQTMPWVERLSTYNWDDVKISLRVLKAEIINTETGSEVAARHIFKNNSKKQAKFSANIDDLNSIDTSWGTSKMAFDTKIDYNINIEESSGIYPHPWVQLDPGQKVASNLRVTRNEVTLKVVYEATLIGYVSCTFIDLFKRIKRNYDAVDILKAANLPISVTATEEIIIGFYTDGELIISNK